MRDKLSRREMLRFTGGAAGVALLAACAPATGSIAPIANQLEPVTITFMAPGGPPEQAAFQSVVEGFHATNTHVHHAPVKVDLIGVASTSDFLTRLTADIATGTPADLFLLNYRRIAQFYNGGALEPLGSRLANSTKLRADDFYPIALDAFRDSQGTPVALPQNASSLVVYYNKDLFNQLGVAYPKAGWNWEEFRQLALDLTIPSQDGDSYPDRYGLGLEPFLIRMAAFIWQNGGDLVDNALQPTRFTLAEPATRAALEFILNLGHQDGVVPIRSAEVIASHHDRFLAGNIAMYVDSRVFVPTLRTSVEFNWDVAPLPQGKMAVNVLHSDGYTMSADSKAKDAAWAFTEYALGTEGQERASRLGRTVPSLRHVAEGPAFLDSAQSPAHSQVWLDNLPILRALPKLENWPVIERAAGIELEQAYLGYASLDEVIANVHAVASDGFAPIK